MALVSIINQFQTTPKAVFDLCAAIGNSERELTMEESVRSFLYPKDNDSAERFKEYLSTAESLGIVDSGSVAKQFTDAPDQANFARLIRRAFKQAEIVKGPNSLVYLAYRAALATTPRATGGLPPAFIDTAETFAETALGPTEQRRFTPDKITRWRAWVSAAGLAFSPPQRQRGSLFVVCPVLAISDELETLPKEKSMTVSEFFDSMVDIPLVANPENPDRVLPDGTSAALSILETRGRLMLSTTPDAAQEWHLSGRAALVTHVEVR